MTETLAEALLKKARRKVPPPKEHDVYVAGGGNEDEQMRRVIAVKDGRVCYSTGGNTNRWCNLKTFMTWLRKPTTKKAHDGQSAST